MVVWITGRILKHTSFKSQGDSLLQNCKGGGELCATFFLELKVAVARLVILSDGCQEIGGIEGALFDALSFLRVLLILYRVNLLGIALRNTKLRVLGQSLGKIF